MCETGVPGDRSQVMARRVGAMRWLTSALCLLLLLHSSAHAAGRYRTEYACERTNLSISCEQFEVIHLVRAIYGRFTTTICNENTNPQDWSPYCESRNSRSVIMEKCADKQSCNVPASNAEFGDPCYGTYKYLEVFYLCVPAGRSTDDDGDDNDDDDHHLDFLN